MDAIVSAVASRVIFIDGAHASFIDAERPGDRKNVPLEDVPTLLIDAYDAEVIRRTDEQAALALLLRKWNSDRALRMLQLLIAPDEDDDIRYRAADYLASLISDADTRADVENIVFSLPASSDAAWRNALAAARRYRDVVTILRSLESLQAEIAHVRDEWSAIPTELFGDDQARSAFEFLAVRTGAFKELVRRDDSNAAILNT